MPIYEYRRPDGSTFEVLQSFSEEPLAKDPDTGVKVQRVLHAPAVHFKGKGFYNTDYGTRKRQRETAAENASKEASGSSSETSSTDTSKNNGKGSSSEGKADKGSAAKKSEPVAAKS
jgi:putative FmdB family regulatory protein